jgi:hypothetical protein
MKRCPFDFSLVSNFIIKFIEAVFGLQFMVWYMMSKSIY